MEYLDLHWTNEEPDLDIAPDGILCKDMNDITERIAEVKDTVKKINLSNQQALTSIPEILGECKNLEELEISYTKITEIPDFLFELPNLRSLSCRCSLLLEFPKGFSNAIRLEKLHLRINKDWAVPHGITSLQNLRVLAIDLYSDTAFPEDLGNLHSLEELSLSIKYDKGTIPSLPLSFNNHPALKKLSISDPFYFNKKHKTFDLDVSMQILSSCLELKTLRLAGLAVGQGHEKLSMLSNIKELELRHLFVEGNIFDSIAPLNYLEKLDLWGSEFKTTEIPDIFTGFNELRSFSFAGNIITKLPPSIYTLAKLTSLEIGSTLISSLDEKIAKLQNLETLHVFDNILQKLPDALFTLPRLKLLNIEENSFSPNTINAIKEKLNTLEKNGQTIQFSYERQGNRLMVKTLRALANIENMDEKTYASHCLNAVNENVNAIKYVNKNKLQGSTFLTDICMTAVKKSALTLENIDPAKLGGSDYFLLCMEAAKSPQISSAFKFIRDDSLSDNDYIQISLEAAQHNKSVDFINNFNKESFSSRFSREVYERICKAVITHHPPAIYNMVNPTREIMQIAERHGGK